MSRLYPAMSAARIAVSRRSPRFLDMVSLHLAFAAPTLAQELLVNLVDGAASNTRRCALISAALGLARPFDAETVSRTDVQVSVWPLSFWKDVCGQYQFEWRTLAPIIGPVAGYVNSRIVKRKGLTRHQTQFVAELRLFGMVPHRAIE